MASLPLHDISTNVDTREKFLPFVLLPVLILIAAYSFTSTLIVLGSIGISVLYVYSRPQQKNRSPFFYSWTLASGLYMFLVYNFVILMYREITIFENLIFNILLGCMGFFFYKTRRVAHMELSGKGKTYCPVITSESKYCQICQLEVNERYFHTIWWGCCIYRSNYVYYLLGQLFAFIVLLVGSNFGLTTVCQPYVFYGSLLMPDDCSKVYFDSWSALSFVLCMYAVGYLLVLCLILLRQVFLYLPKYTGHCLSKPTIMLMKSW